MDADLDLLLTAVFAAADDLLPERRVNARRSVTDAEVVTLAVAQAMLNVSSDRDFLAAARIRLGHLFPKLPGQPGFCKRRQKCTETIDWLIGMFAQDSLEFPRFCGHLTAVPTGAAGRMFCGAQDPAVSEGVPARSGPSHPSW